MIEHEDVGHLRVKMPNHPLFQKTARATDIVSPDALALVRFGLRKANDPRVLDTVKILDATLKRDTARGPGWVRSTDDGYGEKRSLLEWPLTHGE